MDWKAFTIDSTDHHTKFGIEENSAPITQERFLSLLRDSEKFIRFYSEYLAASGFEAFFWENKPVRKGTLGYRYECNLVGTTSLANKKPDHQTFSQYFKANKQVVTFPNRGGDALLVVPCPAEDKAGYTHIGTFVRQAGEDQIAAFWKAVGEQTLQAIGQEPRWLSTSGLGVYWLHARIDSRPKYYQTEEFKKAGDG